MGGIDDNSKVVIATLQAKVNELERELKKSNPQNGSLSSSNRNTMTVSTYIGTYSFLVSYYGKMK